MGRVSFLALVCAGVSGSCVMCVDRFVCSGGWHGTATAELGGEVVVFFWDMRTA